MLLSIRKLCVSYGNSLVVENIDDCALIYASHLRMSFVMKPNVEGFTAHPSDYYEITAALDKT